MRTMRTQPMKARGSQLGLSMVELMIAITLGLLIMAALASLFANTSASRKEMDRAAQQIENGRFAMELLSDDLRLAGFYGELDVSAVAAPGALVDPCSTAVADWKLAIKLAVQGYDTGTGAPTCLPADLKAGTDILVVRRVATCEADTTGCEAKSSTLPYIQVSKCSPENVATPYTMGLGAASFPLFIRNCTTVAGVRRYLVRIYYISTNNGATPPVSVPTLKRLDFTGAGFTETPLVEGIEELNIEYGIDYDRDGRPNVYSADPTNYTDATCAATCNAVNNWSNVVTARINLLSRNTEASPNYTDTKTYTLGRNAAGAEYTVTPGGAYRRHVYTGVVRVLNVAQRKEIPT
jgi:type IV pilus assembly protein PilW